MTREDREALCVLAFEAWQKNGMSIARREIADLLEQDYINIVTFGDMVNVGRVLTAAKRRAEEKAHAQ